MSSKLQRLGPPSWPLVLGAFSLWTSPVEASLPKEPEPRISVASTVFTLLPSPELGLGDRGPVFGLRWQVTPLVYSFGIDPRLRPWRTWVVEPIVRHSGSLELFVSPEYLAIGSEPSHRFGVRVGVRSYFPLLERGDYVSASLGVAYLRMASDPRVAAGTRVTETAATNGVAAYEAGVYILFGTLGAQVSYAPGFAAARWLGTLKIGFF